jgi:translation initiation factor 1
MGAKRADRIASDAGALRVSLGDALARRGVTVSQPTSSGTPAADRARAATGFPLDRAGKITLRREKKGRGGKTVTVIAGLNWPTRQLDELARTLRKAFGCGSSVAGDTVVLQGDMTARAERWLLDHGARQVVIGN